MKAMDRWGHGRPEGGMYWTPERCEQALRSFIADTTGMLPRASKDYWDIKAGRADLPCWASLKPLRRKHGPLMGHLWLGLGAPPSRVHTLGAKWTKHEEATLLEAAGSVTLHAIAKRLHRSYGACRRKLYDRGVKARNNQGYMSAKQVADEYGLPYRDVIALIHDGRLPATIWHENRYQVDPIDAMRLLKRGAA